MDRLAKDTQATTHITTLLAQDRNGEHLSENDLQKAVDAVQHVLLILAKHSISIEINKL